VSPMGKKTKTKAGVGKARRRTDMRDRPHRAVRGDPQDPQALGLLGKPAQAAAEGQRAAETLRCLRSGRVFSHPGRRYSRSVSIPWTRILKRCAPGSRASSPLRSRLSPHASGHRLDTGRGRQVWCHCLPCRFRPSLHVGLTN
jgi:hypothetical protein